jgi:hypothetical protein
MDDLGQFTRWIWAATAMVQVFLLSLLVVRRNVKSYPAFTTYIFMTLAQSGLVFMAFKGWGFFSSVSWRVGWATQSVVLGARAFAVAELCRHILGRFRGIWVLARSILFFSGVVVLVYALVTAKHEWRLLLNTMELGVELAAAAVIVTLLLFARYYEVAADRALRLLAVGLCAYSCISVLNDAILERFLARYVPFWNVFGMVSFLACLFLWSWAFRKPAPQPAAALAFLDSSVYLKLVPEVNWRLRSLDKELIQMWRLEAPRS